MCVHTTAQYTPVNTCRCIQDAAGHQFCLLLAARHPLSTCMYNAVQYIHVCAHVHVYTTVQYVHTCVYMSAGHQHCHQHCHRETSSRAPACIICLYNCTVHTCKYTYTDVYRTLPLRETHSASALKECICSHVCIQMYSTHLQIHVDVHSKHQFCHCMTPTEHLHVKNVHVCVHVYVSVCVIHVYRHLRDTLSVTVRHPSSTCMYVYTSMFVSTTSTVHRYTDINLQGTHSVTVRCSCTCICPCVCTQLYSMCTRQYTCIYNMAVASGPAGPVLAGPVFAFKTAHAQRYVIGVAPQNLLRCDHSASCGVTSIFAEY